MFRRILPALLLVVTVAAGSGCIVRKLRVSRKAPSGVLATASLQDLVGRIQTLDAQVHTINATVNMEPSVGSVNKGEISEYQNVRGFVLIRKPAMFRMIGLAPVVGTRIFDMTTDGTTFKIQFPTKNKVVEGHNQMEKPSEKKLENIRPQHVFDAIVIAPVGPGERAVLENLTDEADANYIVHVLLGTGQNIRLARNLWFERSALHLSRQVIFDPKGDIITDARYDNYKVTHGIPFPHTISIMRPMDEYGVKLTVQKLDLNHDLEDEKFELNIPKNMEVIDLDKRPESRK